MPLHVLSPREVQAAGSGDHADGGGLFLRVKESNANWLLRYTSPSGRRRDMGLGVAHRDTMPAAGESLRLAREKAKRARDDLAAGRDPIDAKRAARRADAERTAGARAQRKAEALTLARVARAYHERAIEPGMNAKYSEVWIRSLECHVPPAIWNKPVAEVGAVELFEALAKVKRVLPETANRVRRRLAAAFDDAIFFGHCTVNPAGAIRRKLTEVAAGKESANLRALPYDQVPAFVAELRKQQGVAARCLEFALLTAARTAEVLGATWNEIDERAGAWTIQGARMKGGDDHTVYLSRRALAILMEMRAIGSGYVFPSPMNVEKPLSNMGMLTLLDRGQRQWHRPPGRDRGVPGAPRSRQSASRLQPGRVPRRASCPSAGVGRLLRRQRICGQGRAAEQVRCRGPASGAGDGEDALVPCAAGRGHEFG